MDKETYLEAFEAHLRKRDMNLEPDVKERIGLYFFLLYQQNQTTNLTRLFSPQDVIDFHLCDSLELSKNLPLNDEQSLIDVGSGAGIPGLLLKCLNPALRVTILDSVGKKIDFVQNVINKLGFKDSNAISARGEDLGHDDEHREMYDYAIARALGSQSYCLELCCPFVKVGGHIVLLRSDEDLIKDPDQYRETLGCVRRNTHQYNIQGREKPFRLEFYQKNAPTLDIFPRKPGKMKKRPL
jgi:16S rRNA (guanine527-N7)-methyltransferase